ncbi:MAG: hypothetical protein JXL80_02355 [Planctomycetes bacterium]|nr:hypothetical protein [Planctomycetota bacterium]
MTRWYVTIALAVSMLAALTVPAAAQRNTRRDQQDNQQKEQQPQPLTKAQKAQKMFSDAEALWQTGRGREAADLYESLVKDHPTSELVPEALAKACVYYGGPGTTDGKRMFEAMRKTFPNSQYNVLMLWSEVERATARDSKVPVKNRISLLETYLDTYWAQSHFSDVVQRLAQALVQDGQTENADALLSRALAETPAEGMGGMINMIQRGSSGRKDFESLAKIWGGAAEAVDNRMPVYPVLALLEITYLRRADSHEAAMKKTDALEKLRPKSEYAAYCALEARPGILAKQEKWAEAAAELKKAIDKYGIFVLPEHHQQLAEYEGKAGNTKAAVALLDKLLDQSNWPAKARELLEAKYALLTAAGDTAAANQVNAKLASMFPAGSVALSASLRTVGNQITAGNAAQAKDALLKIMADFGNTASVAAAVYPYFARFDAKTHEAELAALKDQFLKTYPASPQSDEIRKQQNVDPKDTPAAKAQEVYEEYKTFAGESNVDAARRRIEKLLQEFPSSPHGIAACGELAKALKDADKVEMAAELYLLGAQADPFFRYSEDWLRDSGAAFNGVAKPDKAWPAYDVLVKNYRFSAYWRDYVHTAAATLDNQNKLDDAVKLVVAASKSLGSGPQGADLEAFQARRLERQEKWADAATEMLRILGTNASNPLYRPLSGETFRFLVVADLKDQEAKLLENLANRYEGWDEADRIRISLSTTYARDKKAPQAVKLLEEIEKRHQGYEIGACGHEMIRYLSKYSVGLFSGTVGVHPVNRVEADMSGGYGNYLYAHTAEDMVDYALLLNEPQAFVDRVKKRLNKMTKVTVNRPRGYISGIPYKTPNVPQPHEHPLPEHRWVYGMVAQIDEGMRRMQQRVDAALWLQVYPLWPEFYLNDERITAAACALIAANDRGQTAKATAILNAKYNKLIWAPDILNAQARYEQNNGSRSNAVKLFKQLATGFPDNRHAAAAAETAQTLGGRG